MPPLITLTTDFGTRDGYVGAMKGVIFSHVGDVRVVDLTHDVPPQDVLAGAFALAQAAPWFPPDTIHVAVVDPGVGTERQSLVIEHQGQVFVGPDNGLFSLAAPAPARAFAIDVARLAESWRLQPTFHGRDLFARVAARIAAGEPRAAFATLEVTPRALALPALEAAAGEPVGEVIHVDRFGNLVTNLALDPDSRPASRPGGFTVEIGGVPAESGTTYGDVESGRLVAYRGSAGYLEVAVRDGSAAALLGAGRGSRVRLRRRP